ncbi:MAG: FAD-dependent oxidoreductase [Microgenomates group bacterium]
MKIAVVGAGITGLTTAYRLSQKNYKVVVFEKEKFPGGLAAGFKKENWDWSVEYFFHHLFTSDQSAKKLISELNLSARLFYSRPKTSIFYQGKISQFDSPINLLFFPHLNFPEKIRAALATAYLKMANNWQKLEKISAWDWLISAYGKWPFRILWQPLLQGKFGKQAKKISAAWFWARIKRRSTKLGYLRGGFQVLVNQLLEKIKENGGQIILDHEVKNLKELKDFDRIIITTPTEKFFKTNLPPMLGAINLILILKDQFLTDGTYWLNINEPNFPFVAVVEHTNFVDSKHYGGERILYVGGYYPQNHCYFGMNPREILLEFLPFLKKINKKFDNSSITNYELRISKFAQPIMVLNYSKILSELKRSLPKNIYLANMQTIYPWDRGVNYAIDQGEKVANEIP